jgi:hypothetical protein
VRIFCANGEAVQEVSVIPGEMLCSYQNATCLGKELPGVQCSTAEPLGALNLPSCVPSMQLLPCTQCAVASYQSTICSTLQDEGQLEHAPFAVEQLSGIKATADDQCCCLHHGGSVGPSMQQHGYWPPALGNTVSKRQHYSHRDDPISLGTDNGPHLL